MNKIVIDEKYSELENFINSIPQNFDNIGEITYKGRNTIRKVECDGYLLNIKSYKIPILLNKIAYSFFRKSKCRRAFEYAQRLIEKGFGTPEPVAYIENRKNGLLVKSYFVSIHCVNMHEFREFQRSELTGEVSNILQQLAIYNASLHNNGILHLDFSPGNILIDNSNDDIKFMLVDINRMRFQKVSQRAGMLNFGRLCLADDKVVVLAKAYAAARNIDENYCVDVMLENNKRTIKKFTEGKEKKRKFLAILGKK